MAISTSMAILIAILGTTIFFAVIGLFIFLYIMLRNAKYNVIVRIMNYTNGKPFVETHRACIQRVGEGSGMLVYYIPALKRLPNNMCLIPYEGGRFEYYMKKKRTTFISVTFANGQYSHEVYDPILQEEREIIEEVPTKEVGKDGKPKITFVKTRKLIDIFVNKPVKQSMRYLNLQLDTIYKEDYQLGPGFWDKYGHFVISFAMISMTISLLVIITIFYFNYLGDINSVGDVPGWAQALINSAGSANAPPPMG